jgi:cell division protein FtsL
LSMDNKEKIEFIDPKIEKEELTKFSFKGIIDGSVLTVTSVVKQIPFILFLVFLAVVYIANRYHAEKVVRQINALEDTVRDLQAEQLTTASELMDLSKPSKVQELINKKGLGLNEPNKPPYKILVKR